MKKRKYKSVAYVIPATPTEVNSGELITEPDQAMSVRQIMRSYVNGTLDPLQSQGNYTEDLPDLRGLDITQLHELRRESEAELRFIKDRINEEKEAKRLEKIEAQKKASIIQDAEIIDDGNIRHTKKPKGETSAD